ncbi:hypothetical protein BC828DRAFT_373962, partial [Blastocladiella britannica]
MDPESAPTIGLYVVSGLLTLGYTRFLVRRAFPTSTYFPSQSAMQYTVLRCRFLLAAAILLLIDTGNSIWYWSFHINGIPTDTQFMWYRMIFCGTVMWVGPALVAANAMRCAIIVMRDPRARRSFVRGAAGVCVAVGAVTTSAGVLQAIKVLPIPFPDRNGISYLPTYAAYLMGVFPITIALSSAWSLWMASRSGVIGIRSGANSVTSSSAPATVPLVQETGTPRRSSRWAQWTKWTKPKGASNGVRAPSHSRPIAAGKVSFAGSVTPSSFRPQHHTSGNYIGYKVSGTFWFLSVTEIGLWLLAIAVTLYQPVPAVRGVSVVALLANVALVLEASFEVLLRFHAGRPGASRVQLDQFMEKSVALGMATSVYATATAVADSEVLSGNGDAEGSSSSSLGNVDGIPDPQPTTDTKNASMPLVPRNEVVPTSPYI